MHGGIGVYTYVRLISALMYITYFMHTEIQIRVCVPASTSLIPSTISIHTTIPS